MKFFYFLLPLFCLLGQPQNATAQCPFQFDYFTQPICDGNGYLEVFIQGGNGPYTIEFLGEIYTNVSGQYNIDVYFGGQFIMTITDVNGEICEEEIFIEEGLLLFVEIVGPECVSPDQPAELQALVNGSPNGGPYNYYWNTGESTSSITVIEPGEYFVDVFDFNGCAQSANFEIESGGFEPEIEVIAGAICETDTISSNCQKVCTNTVVTYEVTNANGAEVEWEIDGAEEFSINGSQVTVTWGEAGFGELTTTIGDGGQLQPEPFQVFCGQENVNSSNGTGSFFIFVDGGLPNYALLVDGGNFPPITQEGLMIFNNFDPGQHIVQLTDANGETSSCEFTIVPSPEPFFSAFPIIQSSTTPNTCDGSIVLEIYSNSVTNQYNFLWIGPNGFIANSPTINNLCCGTFNLQVQDDFGDIIWNMDVEISCETLDECGGQSNLCVEILENPIANFTTNPPSDNGVLNICKGQPIEFFNESEGASTVIWDFGDLTNSVFENPVHTYPNPGQYEVTLLVRNDCFCSDTTTLIVNVSDLELPEIECTGTICKGETVTYRTAAECGAYTWTITGDATILEGGTQSDNFITVEWNEGPEGLIELAVSGCNPVLCESVTSAVIPIITDDVSLIEGPDKVCPDEVATYSITDFGGSEFTWAVSGGNILSGQGTNQISVLWVGSPLQNPHSVSVNYENCFLNCGGSDELPVFIRSEYYVAGPIQLCANESGTFNAIDAAFEIGTNVFWTLINASGTTVFTDGPSFSTNIDFTFPAGFYTLQTTPQNLSNACTQSYNIRINVTALPLLPVAINGATEICPNQPYTYTANGLPGHEYYWRINNGGATSGDFGENLTVIWGDNPPYELTLSQISQSGLQCESETISLNINPLPSFAISGNDQLCREETGTYQTTNFQNVDYNWTINPSTAGTIISGANSNDVEVVWHSDGSHNLSVDICGTTETFLIKVFVRPDPTVLHTDDLCPNQLGQVSTTEPYDSYQWKSEAGTVISTIPNPSLSPGYYEVVVTDANGCTGNDIFQITGLPQPSVNISTPGILGLCPTGTITIFATENTGTYTYQWFHDGDPIGTNSSTLDITETGLYWVSIIDENGCTALSNGLLFLECADLGGTCINGQCVIIGTPNPGCTPIGSLDFTSTLTNECDVIDFTNTSINHIPGTLVWNFRDPASGNNISALENPSHTFSLPGFYYVLLTGKVQGTNGDQCDAFVEKLVMVPAVADFEAAPGCVGSPVQFSDNSSFLPEEITEITNWEWDFGDPASGANNTSTDQHPTHIYNDNQTYTVTLTITTTEGCTASKTKTVSVNAAPVIDFVSPSMNCQNASLAFNLNFAANENIVDIVWDFDDPSSGDANVSTQQTAYHAFANAGNYNVTATATNIYGCLETYSTAVLVEQNNLSGLISPPNPSPICLGETLDLTASPGGVSWQWSNGATTEMITVGVEAAYEVTVTDADGCTYSPPPVLVEILPVPFGSIQAVEYNEFDQPTNYFDDNYTICEGEEVYLLAQTSINTNLQWSTGDIDEEISFTDDKGNLLTTGTYNYSVTITSIITGCTSIAGPFEVIVHPTPNDVTISSNMGGGTLCDGTGAILSIDNPDPALTYVWNTGETTNSIEALAAGEYFVRVINAFGCQGESNKIQITNAPNLNSVPSGCFFACVSDTICLPNIPNIAAFQWYQDGVLIAAPNGTVADLIVTESGSYVLEMTDIFGCTTLADPVDLTLTSGFGNILGEVYFDVNENGIIDAADTLVSGVEMILIENGVFLDSTNSNSGGLYAFANQLSSNYTILLNSNQLPNGWAAYQTTQSVIIEGCRDEDVVDFLLFKNCTTLTSELMLETCEGTPIDYNGTMLSAGNEQDFTLQNAAGCDSIVSVSVMGLPVDSENLELATCEGSMVNYNGTMLSAGDVEDFTFQNENGCDSTVTVSVIETAILSENLTLATCEGTMIDYNGTMLAVGDEQDFTFTSANNCDSIVTVSVTGLAVNAENLELETCEGTMIDYNGTMLSAGDEQDFTFQNMNGCDSIVTVSVTGTPVLTEDLELETCPNTTVDYNGEMLGIGDAQDFTFQSINGCDSVVSVSVIALPPDMEDLELATCEGETIDYNGTELAAGDQMDFTFQNVNGCDSIVSVSVGSLPMQNEAILFTICEGETINYQGFELAIGANETFNLQNQFGCDSIINVSVDAFPLSASTQNFDVCKNGLVVIGNTTLEVGDTQDFIYQNSNGCDSTVTVTVTEVPEISFDLAATESCLNEETGILEVVDIQGDTNDLTFSINGMNYQNEPLFENLPAGNYVVTSRDENGCLHQEAMEITLIPPLEIITENAIIDCNEPGIELSPIVENGNTNDLIWEWEDGTNSTTHFAQNPGTFTVDISNDCETITRSIEVNFAPDDRVDLFHIPNVFSPNGDDVNDKIQVYFAENVEVESFLWRIFDRWGNLLFETDSPDGKWNGVHKGKTMKPAVIVYYIEATVVACGQERREVFRKGDIVIMR